MNVLSYVESVPFDIANEGLFYCFRAFNELDWPKEMRGDFFFDGPSSIPRAESRVITLAILAGIKEQEGKPLDEIDKETLNKYAVEIGDAGDVLAARLLIAHRQRISA
ncbi:hypothetical protein GTP45_17815 [Pseudoduganella sp. FT55W]|uniref:Uncharacterized protein n=1 Tax=Duganella rivi TaxID=2666083 RepID=A0A7X4KBZ9_9BURK|nr:hypothetical protein [Duganella rivi]MYM68676.1 hypothetical protein [Duganella rivi]